MKSRQSLGVFERVLKQQRDSHGPNSSRHRRDEGRHFRRLVEGHVADETLAALLGGVGNGVDAAVDHNRTRLDPITW